MMNLNLSRSYSYSRVAKEDPDEKHRRRARRLISKELQKADSISRQQRSSPRLVIISKFKIKVGSRLKRLRKTVSYSISVARSKVRFCRKIVEQIKNRKKGIRIRSDEADMVMLAAPMFTVESSSEIGC